MANDLFYDRIIAGTLKGRKLLLPKSEGVRPSKNRVRQAVFNLLGARLDWEGLSIGDLFCGSGAWGLEAMSRGAAKAVLVDMDERTAATNVKDLGLVKVTVTAADVRQWKPSALLDVVMLDPPYGKGLAQAVIDRAALVGKRGSWWCVETGREDELNWTGFEDVEFRDYGASRVWVARQV
ncbi:MAG: methyltransferase [Blastochloris viridis]|uniref:Methyltransferase n=1 Tax=Blastochloris viridis TaxID=1079 RepID=A0A6N4RFI8_BLAVI|nr:MAG: methyltransferase [Blastochloris viridis]